MSLFDTIIVQPIFNLLLFIYSVIPGQDFGISIILFAVIVRFAMLPLIKKQLHQTKLMRKIQPELKKIKAKAKGNRQLEGQLMLELYRERGVNPFGTFAVLLIQLPIFIALFRVIQVITTQRERISEFTYGFMSSFAPVRAILDDPSNFHETFLGFIDLTQHAIGQHGVTISLLVLAGLSAYLQYRQSKQVTPVPTTNKRLRDILKESAAGKEADQSEISAIMSQRMIKFFPIIAFVVALNLPGALVLLYAASSGVAVVQQYFILKDDVEEMEALVDKTDTKSTASTPKPSAQERADRAQPAVTTPHKKQSRKKRKQR